MPTYPANQLKELLSDETSPRSSTRQTRSHATIRPATYSDLPQLATIASEISIGKPWAKAYFPGVAVREHIKYQYYRFEKCLGEAKTKVYIATTAEASDTELGRIPNPMTRIIGYVMFRRVDLSDLRDSRREEEWFPQCANVKCITTFRSIRRAWTDQQLEASGPHIRGESMGVVPHHRQHGIAADLVSIVAAEAERAGLRVHFETVLPSMPFFAAVTARNNWDLRFANIGPVGLESDEEVTVHFMIAEKREVVPPKPEVLGPRKLFARDLQ